MFIAAVFIIGKTWKQPKCPLTDEWINSSIYAHTHYGIYSGIKKKVNEMSFYHASVETNLTSIHEDTDSIPGLAQCVKDPVLLWLYHRLAAIAPI